MEIKKLINEIAKYKILLLISIVLGIAGGIALFISPKTYTATGSLFVKRSADTLKFKYFAYEGYYAQQTALEYTDTVISILESTDIRFEALNKLNLPTDSAGLRKYSRLITAKKAGPQLITLTVKEKGMDKAKDLWTLIADNSLEKNKQLNTNGDPLLFVNKVSDQPIVRESYRPLWLCITAGIAVAISLVISFITLKGYSKWK